MNKIQDKWVSSEQNTFLVEFQPPAVNFKPGASLPCKGRTASVRVLLWVRECSQGLFVLLDLAADEHEIFYLKTRW
jgi:hypothetical protein